MIKKLHDAWTFAALDASEAWRFWQAEAQDLQYALRMGYDCGDLHVRVDRAWAAYKQAEGIAQGLAQALKIMDAE